MIRFLRAILCRLGLHRYVFVQNDGRNVDMGTRYRLLVCERCMKKALTAKVT